MSNREQVALAQHEQKLKRRREAAQRREQEIAEHLRESAGWTDHDFDQATPKPQADALLSSRTRSHQ